MGTKIDPNRKGVEFIKRSESGSIDPRCSLSCRFFIFILYQRGYCFRRRRSFNTFNMTNARRGIRSSIHSGPQRTRVWFIALVSFYHGRTPLNICLWTSAESPALLRIYPRNATSPLCIPPFPTTCKICKYNTSAPLFKNSRFDREFASNWKKVYAHTDL